jgi:acetylornithine deacetylase
VTLDSDLADRIRAAVDADAALALLQAAVRIPSVTGDEDAFARWVAAELQDVGADGVTVEEFLPGRPNVWGVARGDGGGRSLLFAGHLDTVHVRGWEEHWRGDVRESPFAAPVVDGQVWGRGVGDLKAGICAVLAALRTLRAAGLAPRGDVTALFLGDEESGEPDTGISAGIQAVLPHLRDGRIPRGDLAVYVEPTELQVYAAQMGFFIAEIRLTGRSAYFGTPELGIDALRAGHDVLTALWQHNDDLDGRAEHELLGRPFLLATGVEAGGYVAVPGSCTISVIRKLLPGESLDEARAELDAVVAGAIRDERIGVDVVYTAPRDHPVGGTPDETPPQSAGVPELQAAIRSVLAERGQIAGAPYWSEVPFLSKQLGIPGVYCAPGDIRNCHTFDERVPVEEYLAGVAAFALFIADFCGVQDQHDPSTPRP